MSKELTDYANTQNDYFSNLSNIKNWEDNYNTDVFRVWAEGHQEQFEKGMETIGLSQGMIKGFTGGIGQIKDLYNQYQEAKSTLANKAGGLKGGDEEQGEDPSVEGNDTPAAPEDDEDEFGDGIDLDQDATELFDENGNIASSRQAADPLDDEFGTDDLIGQQMDDETFEPSTAIHEEDEYDLDGDGDLEGIGDDLEEGIQGIGDTANALVGGASEAASNALDTGVGAASDLAADAGSAVSSALSSAGSAALDALGPIGEILSGGLLIYEAYQLSHQSAPPSTADAFMNTASYKGLDVSGSLDSAINLQPASGYF